LVGKRQNSEAVAAPQQIPGDAPITVIAAKRPGVNNYIVKPFNAATLNAKIDAVFGE